jgi:phage terminase small subunit
MRRSQADLNFPIPVSGAPQRLQPPDHLTQPERQAFAAIVASVDPKHFHPSDLPLLASYAIAIVQEQQAVAHLRAEGCVINNKPSPWIVIQEKAHRMMVALSRRLRLSPQGRGRNAVKAEIPVNAYERMRLEELEERDGAGKDH